MPTNTKSISLNQVDAGDYLSGVDLSRQSQQTVSSGESTTQTPPKDSEHEVIDMVEIKDRFQDDFNVRKMSQKQFPDFTTMDIDELQLPMPIPVMERHRSKSIGGNSQRDDQSEVEIQQNIILKLGMQKTLDNQIEGSIKIATPSLTNNKIYQLNKQCQFGGCTSIASRLCDNVCGSFKGCGNYICEEHVRIFAELEDPNNNHFVPYNVESRSVSADMEAQIQQKYVEKYICCSNPKCHELLQEEINKKDQRENCILYAFLIFLLIGIITVTMLLVPKDWAPVQSGTTNS